MTFNAVELEKYLAGTHYPANKNDLRNTAKDNQAPDLIIDIINNLPNRRFNSSADVSHAVQDIE